VATAAGSAFIQAPSPRIWLAKPALLAASSSARLACNLRACFFQLVLLAVDPFR